MKYPLWSLLTFFVSKKKAPQLQGSELPEDVCRQFSIAEIEAATNNFHPDSIIGIGRYGSLYKGTIDDGTVVALRRCRSSLGAVRELQNEVRLLCQLRYPHLVSLIGFCVEGSEMVVVLEYMSRGSLADFLFGIGKDYVPLSWKHRLHICIGAARGLHYLHTGAKHAVIHRHINSSSILLDEEWCCKLSDFGLSKLGPRSMSKALIRMNTRPAGTIGYVDPEYALYGELTEKSDVFSFGVVLFEVVFGKKAFNRTSVRINEKHMLEWAADSLWKGTIYHDIDPYLKGRIAPECLNKYLEIASSCVHRKGNERPAMGEVEVTLELALELQERADSKMDSINPCMYEEELIIYVFFQVSTKSSKKEQEMESWNIVKAATNNFDQDLIIGSSGFEHVYKGFLNDWNLVIAVKRLYPDSAQGFNEFQAELLLLCQLHHQHVVPLIGFCNEKAEMILQRLEICIGAARGLRYLHTGAKQAIIHRDVKSSNILLDDKLVCKLSDFGLAKLRPRSNCKQKTLTRIDSMVKGTRGYADPEYVAGFGLTEKSVVYSFGVVLFEVLCGRKAFDMSLNANQEYLVHWARRSIGEGTIYNIIDPYLKGRIAAECFKTFVDIACSCTCPEGNSRLEMGEVEVMLERALELQQKANSDMVRLASCGVYMFEEVSWCALVPEYSSAQIKAATNNSHPHSIIGEGGSGIVYKGTLHDGTIVAVKRLKKLSYLERQFKNEGQLLCQLRHPHLVSLIGFCVEGSEMVFVLEYMSRGSLANFLFGIGKDYVPLSWKHRLHICIGAARGLHYLHTGAKHAVIHRDINSSNLILDEEWCCKLSDFGLSKLGPPSMSKALIRKNSTRVVGTYGYIAPEYFLHGELTEKSDVYSFGVILFEVLFGRRNQDYTQRSDQFVLLHWAKESLSQGTIYHATDSYLKGRIAPECLNKYLEIASSCVHCEGNERPSMGEVEATLELALELQERADSGTESIYPFGECMYEEALFSAFVSNFVGLDSHCYSLSYSDFSDSDSNNHNNNS
ncbi:receptor-like protein kinase FERONIA [Gossypium australe]|uniref:Receptor-like protein kinase FERONIA n=1 Tax=Gossypium australe TaxID=47621 RepID=A0A5B6VYD0_9ROSI|nr:receptor-like protein kinase FERONIA [Gossypium australe]